MKTNGLEKKIHRKGVMAMALSFADAVVERIMAERQWEQKDLAEHLGIDPTTISAWKKKGIIPNDMNLQKLSEIMELDVKEWSFRRDWLKFQQKMKRRGIDPARYLFT